VHCTNEQRQCGGAGAGFFIGDGAGVGKGRQIAGIIMDNYARGRRQAVWLSTSAVRPERPGRGGWRRPRALGLDRTTCLLPQPLFR